MPIPLLVGLGLAVDGHLAQAARLLAGIEVLGGVVSEFHAHRQRCPAGTAEFSAGRGVEAGEWFRREPTFSVRPFFMTFRRPLRSTNLPERSLEEVRRRTKVIGRFPGETSCLTMAWAVMDLVIAGARGLGLRLPDRHAIAALIAARSVPQTEEQIA
jgi:hypothetical protein